MTDLCLPGLVTDVVPWQIETLSVIRLNMENLRDSQIFRIIILSHDDKIIVNEKGHNFLT